MLQIFKKERISYYLNADGCKSSKYTSYAERMPVPVAARSKAYVCGGSPAEIAGSNPTVGMDVCLL